MADHSRDDDSKPTDRTLTTRRTLLRGAAFGASVASLGSIPASANRSQAAQRAGPSRRFKVRIENVSTPTTLDTSEGSTAVPLSPGAYAVHETDGALFTPDEPASAGLETVAEDGMPGPLAEELATAAGVSESGAFALDQTAADPNQPAGGPEPPIFPGGAFEFTVSAAPGEKLSLATMFVQSNDLFLAPGPDGIDLYESGAPVDGDVTDQFRLWDAGTEDDQEPGVGSDQAPRQSGPDTGPADSNSSTVQLVSEVNAEGHDYPAVDEVIRVSVTPVETRPFRVRVENVSTPNTLDTSEGSTAVPLSPGAFAVHGGSGPLHVPGEAASDGLEAIAEDGTPGSLAQELDDAPFVADSGVFALDETVTDPNQPAGAPEPPIFPGGAFEFTVSAAPGDRLSLATMFVQSNDLFLAPGPDGIALYDGDEPISGDVTDQLDLWDAGTEDDQEPGVGSDQAPRQSGPDTGPADSNSSTVQLVADVNAEGHDYPAVDEVIRVSVTPVDPTPFTVRIENVAATDTYAPDSSTGGAVWLTPGAFATHVGENPILTEGDAASPGLEVLAEAGIPTGTPGTSGLVDELGTASNVTGSGAFTPSDTVADPNDPTGEVPGAPPIAPGGAFEFTVTAVPGEKLSVASMFVPSNDLFYAPDGNGIDLFSDGEPREGDVTGEIRLWDAGTEPNQQPGFGSDQAPAQSAPDQGAEEGGVVRTIDDVDDGYSYPAVADAIQVSVTPNPVSRRLSRTAAGAGESIEVTLTAELTQAHDRVFLVDTFTGPVTNTTIDAISTNGSPATDETVAIAKMLENAAMVGLEGLDANTTVEVVYSVDVRANAPPGATIEFGGIDGGPDVDADQMFMAEFGRATATVTTGGAIRDADQNGDGSISTGELLTAIDDWGSGRYTTVELQQIIQAWATS